MKLGRDVPPAGHGRELERFDFRDLFSARHMPPTREPVLSSPVEPRATNWPSGQQGLGRARSGPIAGTSHEVLLAAVPEDVEQALDLGLLLVRDENRLVPASPELLAPSDLSTDLAGEVRVEMVHERGKSIRTLDRQQEMEVIREEAVGVELDREEASRTRQGATDEIGDQGSRPQEESPLYRAARHFDQRAGWDEANSATHADRDGIAALPTCASATRLAALLAPAHKRLAPWAGTLGRQAREAAPRGWHLGTAGRRRQEAGTLGRDDRCPDSPWVGSCAKLLRVCLD